MTKEKRMEGSSAGNEQFRLAKMTDELTPADLPLLLSAPSCFASSVPASLCSAENLAVERPNLPFYSCTEAPAPLPVLPAMLSSLLRVGGIGDGLFVIFFFVALSILICAIGLRTDRPRSGA